MFTQGHSHPADCQSPKSPLVRRQDANNAHIDPWTLFPSIKYRDQVLLFCQLQSFILGLYFKPLGDSCFKNGVKILITHALREEQTRKVAATWQDCFGSLHHPARPSRDERCHDSTGHTSMGWAGWRELRFLSHQNQVQALLCCIFPR